MTMRSSVSVFQTSLLVRMTPEALFAFHAEPRNMVEVMPPTLRLVSVETEGAPAVGGLIRLHCRDWGFIPMHWVCRWQEVSFPHLLVDEMLEGPFRVFVHEHRFTDVGDGCSRLEDRVTYAWGRSWWGRLVSEVGVRGYLKVMFAYRHYRMRRLVSR